MLQLEIKFHIKFVKSRKVFHLNNLEQIVLYVV